MLKALELRGFKSFADKTRLDFPPGITVVVGPNGSGKSNIVDAIKWVLGEQSAKSLRGKEMSDVIFKGAGDGGGRKPANTAEATIVFDNSDARLPVEAPEVHVTRRVYRSGEGEYLINRQACRLRDVRDLFRGTGVGTDAYSLIEQGKVDTLLQASARDRRAIFEEAAGISRFKAKKIEAQRRLERVDQNLLRLSDIVEEVDHRLRTVRSQASKARRYREYTDRLQQLRTQVGRVDWRRLTENLRQIEAELKQLEQDVARRLTLEESLEARALELETEVGLVSEELRACEARLARNRQRLAGQESVTQEQHHRLRELDEEAARQRRQLVAMSMRAGDLDGQLHGAEEELETAEARHRTLRQQVDELQRSTDQLTDQLNNRSAKSETLRSRYVEQVQSSADLGSRISADQLQRSSADTGARRWQESVDRFSQQLARAESELESLREQEKVMAETVRVEAKARDQAQIALRQHRKQLASVQERAGTLKGQRAGGRERADVLAELEARLEGVHSGVREILTLSQNEVDGPFGGVRGLLADLIQVSVDTAAMVDVALGDRSQHLVVAGTRLLDYLRSDNCRLPGRAGFLWLTSSAPRSDAYRVRLARQRGVIGRADEFVEAPPEYQLLIQWLLGSTWFVETLVDAFQLSQTAARGVRFVTRSGELLDSDGRVVAGSSPATVGLVSRRSQLRELRQEIECLDVEIEQLDQQNEQLLQTIETQELDAQQRRSAHEQACAGLSQQRVRAEAVTQRCLDLRQQQTAAQSELQDAQRKQQEAAGRLETAEGQRAEHQHALAQLKQQMQDFEKQIQHLDAERQVASQASTTARVELAKAEQHLESLRVQTAQLHRDQKERSQAQQETRALMRRCESRRVEVQRVILRGSTEIAELYLQQEADLRRSNDVDQRRDTLQHDRRTLGDQTQLLRRELHQIEQKQHEKQLAAGKASLERETLAERLREDYQIELADLEDDAESGEQQQRDAVDVEIRELRRKLSNIGAVNLDALGELEELEGRSESLGGQYRDLVDAKESLQRIIHKINADSRRLFTETLEAIRANFQELFRKVFGGGQADICLEDGVDILDSGIDIIAMPPGKQLLSLSLLSGGERALTAVTLLLAIFQYRPSPFCVLDEVDGPLDEANIGRFIGVLVEFLDWTKFVVVTHSKKTMTAANTLYGITMQESGVSKRVSVQFEDVSDDGHIRREAVQREQPRALSPEGDGRGAA